MTLREQDAYATYLAIEEPARAAYEAIVQEERAKEAAVTAAHMPIPVEEHNRIVAQTITAMDAERVSFEQEIERLRSRVAMMTTMCAWQDTRLASLDRALNDRDTVPRTRYNACNQDWLDAEPKLKTVQTNAQQEIEWLRECISAQGAQMLDYHDAHKGLIGTKEAV